MKPAVIEPDQVSLAPGTAEAEEIRGHYKVAMAGARAFVEMGICLLNVKARLRHGEYMAWCDKHLTALNYRHLHSAAKVASDLLQMANVQHCCTFDELPAEIKALVDGAASQRALMAGIKVYKDDEEARIFCLGKFEESPELRDFYEPRILSGEINWDLARKGIKGLKATEDQVREPAKVVALLKRNVRSFPLHWKAWSSLDKKDKDPILDSLRTSFVGAPEEVVDALEIALINAKKALKGGQR